jgi:hypothetical protein
MKIFCHGAAGPLPLLFLAVTVNVKTVLTVSWLEITAGDVVC